MVAEPYTVPLMSEPSHLFLAYEQTIKFHSGKEDEEWRSGVGALLNEICLTTGGSSSL